MNGAYIGLTAASLFLTVVFRINYTWSMRDRLVNFKHFTIKTQENFTLVIGLVFVIPIVVMWIIQYLLVEVAACICMSQFGAQVIYIMVMGAICKRVKREGTLLEQLHRIRATPDSDPYKVQQQLEHWYLRKYSIRRIKKYLKEMTDNDNETIIMNDFYV